MSLVNSRARRGALLLTTLLVACLLPGQVTASATAEVTSGKWRPELRSTTTTTSGSTADPCGTRVRKATGGYWTCTFAEPFSGTSLDRTKWVVQNTARTGFRMGETCFSDDGSNIRVRDGELTLSVTSSETPFTCSTPTGSFQARYRGADISTWGNFAQTRGRFEARLQFDRAVTAGVHGGFWMNPQRKIYGAWPFSGEIDVAEWWSLRPDYVHPSLHYAGRDFWKDTGWDCHVGRADVYRTYAVEWDKTVMRFYYDGQLCWTRDWEPSIALSETAPFDHPFYVSLSQAAGVPNGWSMDPATGYPATMRVDYVRAWR